MDPAIAFGLLVMGMAIGAMLTRESYRRNVQSIVDQEMEKLSFYHGLGAYASGDPSSPRDSQRHAYQAVQPTGGHSARKAN